MTPEDASSGPISTQLLIIVIMLVLFVCLCAACCIVGIRIWIRRRALRIINSQNPNLNPDVDLDGRQVDDETRARNLRLANLR